MVVDYSCYQEISIFSFEENIPSCAFIRFVENVVGAEIFKRLWSFLMRKIMNFTNNKIDNFSNILLRIFSVAKILFEEKGINQFVKIKKNFILKNYFSQGYAFILLNISALNTTNV